MQVLETPVRIDGVLDLGEGRGFQAPSGTIVGGEGGGRVAGSFTLGGPDGVVFFHGDGACVENVMTTPAE